LHQGAATERSPAVWPGTNRLSVGDVEVHLADNGALGPLLVDGRVAIDRLFCSLRAADWSTIPARLTDVSVVTEGEALRVTVREELPEATATTDYHISVSGGLRARVALLVHAPLKVSRWGFNICLDADALAGARVVLPGGDSVQLSAVIAPQPRRGGVLRGMFPPADFLGFDRADGLRMSVTSRGQLLEMEDQRNWSDPTYKVYSGSLAAPLPLQLVSGQQLVQELIVDVRMPDRRPPPRTGGLRLGWGEPRPLPGIGVQVNDGSARPEELRRLLATLGLTHVRVDVEFGRERAAEQLPDLGMPLELAAVVQEVDDATLSGLAAAVTELPAGSRVLLHRTGRHPTTPGDAARLRALLPKNSPVVITPGTDVHFRDLNAEPPERGASVSFAVVAATHFDDDRGIFETLPVQCQLAEQARQRFGAEVVVSPITLRLRGDPEGRPDDPEARRVIGRAQLDDRLGTLLGAAWTLGSVCALTRAGASSGTWHELLGPRGLIAGSTARPMPTPAFHVLAALRAHTRPEVAPLLGHEGVAGLRFSDGGPALLCSLRPWPQQVDLGVLTGGSVVARWRSLSESSIDRGAGPMSGWEERPVEQMLRTVELGPYEICELMWR